MVYFLFKQSSFSVNLYKKAIYGFNENTWRHNAVGIWIPISILVPWTSIPPRFLLAINDKNWKWRTNEENTVHEKR
jgi:hypothetical protein